MHELVGRRLMTRVGDHVFRVVRIEDDAAIVVKRGQRAQRILASALYSGLRLGALIDITDRRDCPECGAPMDRDGHCRVEWIGERVINGYTDRDKTERKVEHRAVWLCTACEHVEEER